MHPSLPLPPAAPADKPPFVMVIPPPNVTGTLHIGHALTNAIEVRCAVLGCVAGCRCQDDCLHRSGTPLFQQCHLCGR